MDKVAEHLRKATQHLNEARIAASMAVVDPQDSGPVMSAAQAKMHRLSTLLDAAHHLISVIYVQTEN